MTRQEDLSEPVASHNNNNNNNIWLASLWVLDRAKQTL